MNEQASSSTQAVPNLLRERAAIHGSISQVKFLFKISVLQKKLIL